MSFHLKPKSRVLIGNGGINSERRSHGYCATVGTEVVEAKPGKDHHFIDLHMTRDQLEGLRCQIDAFLKDMDEYPEQHR